MVAPSQRTDYSHLRTGLTVLVEEEGDVRKSWEAFFAERKMRLVTYDSADTFLADFLASYCAGGGPIEFFFDQDFGKDLGVGVRLAKIVRNWSGRTGTSLVTAYQPQDFVSDIQKGIIDAVFYKFPEPIFGEDYFKTHITRQLGEYGTQKVIQESVSKFDHLYRILTKGRKEQPHVRTRTNEGEL